MASEHSQGFIPVDFSTNLTVFASDDFGTVKQKSIALLEAADLKSIDGSRVAPW